MKQRLPLVAAIVLIIALVAVLVMSDRYRIVTGNRHTMKIDRLTGKTWRLSSNGSEWVKVGERSSSGMSDLDTGGASSERAVTSDSAITATDTSPTATDVTATSTETAVAPPTTGTATP